MNPRQLIHESAISSRRSVYDSPFAVRSVEEICREVDRIASKKIPRKRKRLKKKESWIKEQR